MLIFNVLQHILRRKQIFVTLKKYFHSDHTRPFWDPFKYVFSSIFRKIFGINIQLQPILEGFPIWCFIVCKKPQKQFGWEHKKGIHMYCQGPVLNHYDHWHILVQSTRNLIIEGVMFNQDTPRENIFFISSKDVMTIKN